MKKATKSCVVFSYIIVIGCLLLTSCNGGKIKSHKQDISSKTNEPKIVNIINFIRLLEPRVAKSTEDVLYETVLEQIKIMRKYKLRGTFLLQYDALMDSRYQKLMKGLPADTFEIGAWWEIPQPMVENAGMKWRGRYPWDWHANVGFSTGYTPEEREKLADVYMNDFKKIFGHYPESVGSWFIDAHTLNYLYDKFHIIASCNCKDQYGTDGYTLWGGYWNQAYYPSRINSFMPAQNEKNQLPVPVFRMLGSDPVRQYDLGLSPNGQGCISLEPIYKFGGGDSTWVTWFFKEFVNGESLEFNYAQAGQENSFTWKNMSKGYKMQMPLIARLRNENKISVETLGESGKWFRKHYKITPATSMTVSQDIDWSDKKTAWFNSRFYRTNFLWDRGSLCIRDIHLFDENFPSFYTTGIAKTSACAFFTLPVVDGYLWSSVDEIAGLRLKVVVGGKEVFLQGADPEFTKSKPGQLDISWPLTNIEGILMVSLDEGSITMNLKSKNKIEWYLEMNAANKVKLPFKKISSNRLDCQFEGMDYFVTTGKGIMTESADKKGFRITPEQNMVIIDLSQGEMTMKK